MNFNFIQWPMEKNLMSKNSSSVFFDKLKKYSENGIISKKYQELLGHFYSSYKEALEMHHISIAEYEHIFVTFLDLIKEQLEDPFMFQPYHRHIREPFDFYKFGLDFMRPLVDMRSSSLIGFSNLKEIADHLKQGHNIILLANHQTEADPQALGILL